MALSTVITGFYTTAQLRSAIGKPTADTADPGYISDTELERIIQRHHDEAVERAKVMAHELIERGELPCDKRLFSHVELAVAVSTSQPGLLQGFFADTQYPYVIQVSDDNGYQYEFDADINRTVKTSFTRRFVYKTIGNTIYVSSGMDSYPPITSIHIHIPLKNDVWDFLFDGEMVRKYNEAILKEAITLMNRTIQEGLRLETILSADDDVPGDLT